MYKIMSKIGFKCGRLDLVMLGHRNITLCIEISKLNKFLEIPFHQLIVKSKLNY